MVLAVASTNRKRSIVRAAKTEIGGRVAERQMHWPVKPAVYDLRRFESCRAHHPVRGCSSDGPECSAVYREVAGSNPVIPAIAGAS